MTASKCVGPTGHRTTIICYWLPPTWIDVQLLAIQSGLTAISLRQISKGLQITAL